MPPPWRGGDLLHPTLAGGEPSLPGHRGAGRCRPALALFLRRGAGEPSLPGHRGAGRCRPARRKCPKSHGYPRASPQASELTTRNHWAFCRLPWQCPIREYYRTIRLAPAQCLGGCLRRGPAARDESLRVLMRDKGRTRTRRADTAGRAWARAREAHEPPDVRAPVETEPSPLERDRLAVDVRCVSRSPTTPFGSRRPPAGCVSFPQSHHAALGH
jgi:hypothetical protein